MSVTAARSQGIVKQTNLWHWLKSAQIELQRWFAMSAGLRKAPLSTLDHPAAASRLSGLKAVPSAAVASRNTRPNAHPNRFGPVQASPAEVTKAIRALSCNPCQGVGMRLRMSRPNFSGSFSSIFFLDSCIVAKRAVYCKCGVLASNLVHLFP